MSHPGLRAAALGVGFAVLGLVTAWPAVLIIGAGMCAIAVGTALHVARHPRLAVERAIEPPRVQKGMPAVAVIHATNLGRRSSAPLTIEQRLGSQVMRATLPRLRRGESALRTYRLPTSQRGVYHVGPVELTRSDPFGLWRSVQRLGRSQRIVVHPRLLSLRAVPTGTSRNLEGPSSDTSPQGTITFHRLREYGPGDDLRSVHWPSTARLGKLVVRHNVDTAQPYTVVLADLRPEVYSAGTFEEAIDVTASVVTSMAADKAPVQLRTTAGQRLGGPAERDTRSLVDYLTEVEADPSGSLSRELLLLRRDRGGTALVVVTGRLDLTGLPTIASLRRRFDRVLVASIVSRPQRVPAYPGLAIFVAPGADQLARAWNTRLAT